jgi:hypothetical protein
MRLPMTFKPFAVQLPLSALLTMELASHLSATEVVGFLEGEWNSETKGLHEFIFLSVEFFLCFILSLHFICLFPP